MVATDNGFVLCLNYPSLLHFMSLSERGSVTFCTLCLVWHNHTCGSKKVGCASSAYERYEDKGRQCRGAGTWAFSIFYAEEKTERWKRPLAGCWFGCFSPKRVRNRYHEHDFTSMAVWRPLIRPFLTDQHDAAWLVVFREFQNWWVCQWHAVLHTDENRLVLSLVRLEWQHLKLLWCRIWSLQLYPALWLHQWICDRARNSKVYMVYIYTHTHTHHAFTWWIMKSVQGESVSNGVFDIPGFPPCSAAVLTHCFRNMADTHHVLTVTVPWIIHTMKCLVPAGRW